MASVALPEPFHCEARRAGARVVHVEPEGELDGSTAHVVADALLDARALAPAVMVIDLRGLTFIDSAGLHLILDTGAWARQAGVELLIVPGSWAVRRLFQISGADRELRLVDRPPPTLTAVGE